MSKYIRSKGRPLDCHSSRRVEAGSRGRLLRVCMAVARTSPEWFACGPIQKYAGNGGKTIFYQEMRANERWRYSAREAEE